MAAAPRDSERITLDDFTVDEAASMATCPHGLTGTITAKRRVTFAAACTGCPFRTRWTTSPQGRKLFLHEHEALQREHRQRAACRPLGTTNGGAGPCSSCSPPTSSAATAVDEAPHQRHNELNGRNDLIVVPQVHQNAAPNSRWWRFASPNTNLFSSLLGEDPQTIFLSGVRGGADIICEVAHRGLTPLLKACYFSGYLGQVLSLVEAPGRI